MFEDRPPLGGRQVERIIRRDRIIDPESGHEFSAEETIEVADTFDGVQEQLQSSVRQRLACGHVHQVGGYVAACECCSEKAGRPIYVCGICIVSSATGQTLCRKCAGAQAVPPCVPARNLVTKLLSLVRRILDWW